MIKIHRFLEPAGSAAVRLKIMELHDFLLLDVFSLWRKAAAGAAMPSTTMNKVIPAAVGPLLLLVMNVLPSKHDPFKRIYYLFRLCKLDIDVLFFDIFSYPVITQSIRILRSCEIKLYKNPKSPETIGIGVDSGT
ncbi:hypothetical protein LXL04_024608 [Taraxacum kok-saghyz]